MKSRPVCKSAQSIPHSSFLGCHRHKVRSSNIPGVEVLVSAFSQSPDDLARVTLGLPTRRLLYRGKSRNSHRTSNSHEVLSCICKRVKVSRQRADQESRSALINSKIQLLLREKRRAFSPLQVASD